MIRHGKLPACFEVVCSHRFHRFAAAQWHPLLVFLRTFRSSLTTLQYDIAKRQISSGSPVPGSDLGSLKVVTTRPRDGGRRPKRRPTTYPEAMKVLSTIAQQNEKISHDGPLSQLYDTPKNWNTMISRFLRSCNTVKAGSLFEALSKTRFRISRSNLLNFIGRQAGIDNPRLAISLLRQTRGMICYQTSSDFQRYIYLVLQRCDATQAKELYRALLRSCLRVKADTLLHFVKRFTHMGSPDFALDALGRIGASGFSMQTPRVQTACVTLLRTAFGGIDDYRVRSQIAARILELGVRPKVNMLNAMILNCVEAFDHDTAYGIFETAKVNNLRRDTMTYSILLKDTAQSLDDCRLQEIVNAAEEDGALPRNNTLVFCLLAATFKVLKGRSHDSHGANPVYLRMLHAYARYCDTEPLRQLSIYIEEKVERAQPVSQPSPRILGIMLVAYLASYGTRTSVLPIYQRYQTLVEQNHALVAPIAETTYVANAFLLSMRYKPSSLTVYPTVLKNMLQPAGTTRVSVARPNVYTWSIVATGYFHHGQKIAGEKVIEMMRASGIEPNQVTWNSIINGYARLQDVDSAMDAMKRMEKAGFKANSYTTKALEPVEDRERVLVALRKVPAGRQKDLYIDKG